MSLRDLQFKQSYSSDEDNILLDFYIPALKESIQYDRLAGYFSSSSLAAAASGIIDLIKNGGNMRIVASPALSKNDIQAIESAKLKPEDYVSKLFVKDIETLHEGFLYDHLKALGWMIANNMLHLKLAFVSDDLGNLLDIEKIEESGLFHQKVGVMYDAHENAISFSGSINESATGWLSNIEEFKVFRSWIEAENAYLETDRDKFNRIWSDNTNRITVIDAPQAIIDKLVSIKPDDIDMINWKDYIKSHSDLKRKKIVLFDHQKEAINRWIDNGKKGIFEMATGTGKTFAALGCIEKTFPTGSKCFIIIACPQKHLVRQWKNEIDAFGIDYDKLIIADGDNPKYKKQLTEAIIDMNLGYLDKLLVLTTHRTLASPNFRGIVQSQKKEVKALLIADEVHGLGASMNKKALIEDYDYRLGLSATPKRWYDDIGTDYLYTYFNEVVYEFDIKLALNSYNPMTGKTYLTPYKYYPKRVFLLEDEIEEYIRLTHSIIKNSTSKNDVLGEDYLQIIRNARANITKNAEYKFTILEEVIKEISSVCSTIVFCSPQQIQQVMDILNKYSLTIHRFTEKEGTKAEMQYGNISQREYLMKKFSEGVYQVLVAIKCIDEGVDVPNAQIAILMSSSTNPREYIQRIGRVVRRAPGKTVAKIYDFIVAPNTNSMPEGLQRVEKLILEKELVRAEDIAKNAINNAEALQELHKMKICKVRR